jgi:hypothetical protein
VPEAIFLPALLGATGGGRQSMKTGSIESYEKSKDFSG